MPTHECGGSEQQQSSDGFAHRLSPLLLNRYYVATDVVYQVEFGDYLRGILLGMIESFVPQGSLDGEYVDTRRKAFASSPRDRHYIEHHESDVVRYETFEELERATNMILRRLSPSSYSADAVLRLRDLNALRIAKELLRKAETSARQLAIRTEILDFPFAYDDVKQEVYKVFDNEMDGEFRGIMALAGRDKRHLKNLRSTVGEIPYISPERHTMVLKELAKAESALNIRLN